MARASGTAAVHAAACNGNGEHRSMDINGGAAAALQLLQEFLQVQSRRAEVYSRFNQGFRDLLDNGQEAVFARLLQEVTPLFNAASQQVISIESALKSADVNRPDLAALLRGVQDQERTKLKLTLSWQALRAAHAAGRFSWQEASDRPRTQGATADHSQHQQQQQQQQQLMALLEEMQLQTAQGPSGGCDVAANGSDQGAGRGTGGSAVKPGFYEQQMQRAVADALAATAASSQQEQQPNSSAHAHGHAHACGAAAGGHGCQHGHDHAPPSDPLEPNNPLEPNEAEFKAAVKEALQELDACVTSINELLEEVREAAVDLQE